MHKTKDYTGIVVPMVTPFTVQGGLDEAAVRRMVDFLIEGGMDGIFVLGTTGEAASMPLAMRQQLVRTTVQVVQKRVRVYAGIGDNCPTHSVESAHAFFKAGVDAVVAHPASYYVLDPEEIFGYYTALAERIPGPILIYNIPATTHISIPIEVIVKLSHHPRIVGLKDSENHVGRMQEVAERLKGRDDFSLLMGSSVLSSRALFLGMDGAVPSSGNLVPKLWRDLFSAAQRGDWARAEELQLEADAIGEILQPGRTLGQSLAALKAALSTRGLCERSVMPPLRTLPKEEVARIQVQLAALGFD